MGKVESELGKSLGLSSYEVVVFQEGLHVGEGDVTQQMLRNFRELIEELVGEEFPFLFQPVNGSVDPAVFISSAVGSVSGSGSEVQLDLSPLGEEQILASAVESFFSDVLPADKLLQISFVGFVVVASRLLVVLTFGYQVLHLPVLSAVAGSHLGKPVVGGVHCHDLVALSLGPRRS